MAPNESTSTSEIEAAPAEPKGLGTGFKAGIGIGAVVGAALLLGAAFLLYKHFLRRRTRLQREAVVKNDQPELVHNTTAK